MEKYNDVRATLEGLLQKDSVLIQINTSAEGLDIPAHLRMSPSTTLRLSYLFRGALALEEDQIVADLTFHNYSYLCTIPYSAIWGVSFQNEFIEIWPDSAPEQLAEIVKLHFENKPRDRVSALQNKKKSLRLIKPPTHLKRVK